MRKMPINPSSEAATKLYLLNFHTGLLMTSDRKGNGKKNFNKVKGLRTRNGRAHYSGSISLVSLRRKGETRTILFQFSHLFTIPNTYKGRYIPIPPHYDLHLLLPVIKLSLTQRPVSHFHITAHSPCTLCLH